MTNKRNVIKGSFESDMINGSNASDTIQGGGGSDTIFAGGGNDVLFAFMDFEDKDFQSEWLTQFSADQDSLSGGMGNDIYMIDLSFGLATILENANEGEDTIVLGLEKNTPSYKIPLNVENIISDTAIKENGAYISIQIEGNDLNNIIQTSPRSWVNLSKLTSGINNIFISNENFYGGKGNDTLKGGAGADLLDGGDDNDELLAGADEDTIIGGLGLDKLSGGSGQDIFIFRYGHSLMSEKHSDQILDFKYFESDKIQLVGLDRIDCHVRDFKEKNFVTANADANRDFSQGKNISIQFVQTKALVFIDFNDDNLADSLITLVGIKVGNAAFTEYAESGEMFSIAL